MIKRNNDLYDLTCDKCGRVCSVASEYFVEDLKRFGWVMSGNEHYCSSSCNGVPANPLKNYTTAELVEELKTRDGVSSDFLEPKDHIKIVTNYDFDDERTGPLTVLYIID